MLDTLHQMSSPLQSRLVPLPNASKRAKAAAGARAPPAALARFLELVWLLADLF